MNESPKIVTKTTSQIKAEKHRAQSAKWRKLNREKALNSTKAWKSKNPDKVRAYQTTYNKNYRLKNLPKLRAQDRAKYARYRDRYIAKTAEWRGKFPERKRVQSAAWYRRNADKIRANNLLNRDKIKARDAAYRKTARGKLARVNYAASRRAKQKGCIAAVTTVELLEIKKAAKGKCFYCRRPAILTLDHIIALSKRGTHTKENIVMACKDCNSFKRAKPVDQFIKEKGFEGVIIPPVQLNLVAGGKIQR